MPSGQAKLFAAWQPGRTDRKRRWEREEKRVERRVERRKGEMGTQEGKEREGKKRKEKHREKGLGTKHQRPTPETPFF